MRSPGVHIRSWGLVSWSVGGVYAFTGGAYPFVGSGFVVWRSVYAPTGVAYPFLGSGFVVCWGANVPTVGVYPVIGSGFVVCWGACAPTGGCISVHWVWFRGSMGVVFLWLGWCFMAIESLSGSWSAQVPERPTAVGSRLVYPRGCRGVDRCCALRPFTRCRRVGNNCVTLRPIAWFWGAGGLAAGWPPGVYIRPLGSVSWSAGGV